MANKINYQYRITKYNPDLRNLNGEYTKEEWISPTQIGRSFDGKVFTIKDYLQVEKAYIDTVISFIKESKSKSLRVIQLERNNKLLQDESSELFEEKFKNIVLEEDLLVNETEITIICKMVLRDYIYCHLISSSNFFVHFASDYYMFIGSNQPCSNAVHFARTNNLFVEEYQSPYYLTEEDIIRMVEWSAKNEEIVLGEEKLSNVPLKEIRKALNLSEEHPVVGSFPINSENKDVFQKYIKHKFDFSKHNYYLWSGS
ncbi:hypothetical protein FOH38_17775 [Lysinibacillus fusiformis]|nr:hypothetical protein FOH38_17775 [Lysinibacillus fusiformis]